LGVVVVSRVILSLQLPFAIVPLVHFTSDRRRMGPFANGGLLKVLAWACALIVVGLNAFLIHQQMGKWAEEIAADGGQGFWIYATIGPIALLLATFLGWVTVYPWWARREEVPPATATPALPRVHYQRIGVAVELEGRDEAVLAQAVALARIHGARLVAIHVVEGFGAEFHGAAADDQESR